MERIKGLAGAMTRPQLMALGALTLTGMMSMIWLLSWAMESKYEPLNYQPFDGALEGEVLEKLDQMRVTYQHNGGLIRVPAGQRDKILSDLGRDQKLAMHGKDFWKWMFEADWTSTEQKTREKILRTNEARLRAVIRKWPRISDARIVITPGDTNRTFAKEKPAKASVMLTLKGSDPLPMGTVTSIANMVSGAVRDLDAHNVKISDGHRLYRIPDPNSAETDIAGYLELLRRYEEHYTRQIRKALGPVGEEAFIAVDLDIDRKSTVTEKKGVVKGSQPSHERTEKEDETETKPKGGPTGVSVNVENADATTRAASKKKSRTVKEIWRDNQQQEYQKVLIPPGSVIGKRVSITIPYKLAGRSQAGEVAADNTVAGQNIAANVIRWKASIVALGYRANEVVVTADALLGDQMPQQAAQLTQTLQFLQDHGGQIFLGLVLAIALLSVVRNLRKSVPDPLDDLLRSDKELVDAQIRELLEGKVPPKFDERSAGLRDRIQDMIRENPQGAALFVGRWARRD